MISTSEGSALGCDAAAPDCAELQVDGGQNASDMEVACDCSDPDCDDASCVVLADGERCLLDADCESGHCDQNICCSGGVCCNSQQSCPGAGTLTTMCEDPSTCQGARGEVLCMDFRCVTVDGVPDDTACDSEVEALTCGSYRSVYCSGEESQGRPECPTSCETSDECDEGSVCSAGTCLALVADGSDCAFDDECGSGFCSGGICCEQGADCCLEATDCPELYWQSPQCEMPGSCQGTRRDALCEANRCTMSEAIADDSACSAETLANDCGLAADLYCDGEVEQAAPACAADCSDDSQCDAGSYCSNGGCVPGMADGNACERNAMCQGQRCENGFCCAEGDCCSTAADCPADVYTRLVCLQVASCEGLRVDPVCDGEFRCRLGDTSVADDGACVGQRALSCGGFPDVYCTDAADQSPECLLVCSNSGDCDPSVQCVDGVCQSR